jgi:superfamily II DNA or RNA helicase
MQNNAFQTRQPAIVENRGLRIPQREAYARIAEVFAQANGPREVGVVLPVGCGKSGLITLTPFAVRARQVLVVAPGTRISEQLRNDFDPARPDMFYISRGVLDGPPFPEPVEIRGTTTNVADLQESDVVVTNIQQLQGETNRWLQTLPQDFFDLILFDEAHHNVAASWELLRQRFPNARIVNFSATPLRADGQLMSGNIIYSYPIFRAIQEGYVKRLKAVVLNPTTLRYVRREGDQEIEVTLDEVRRLGENDADFRRSIVTSRETLATIVDASIREMQRIRRETGDQRHKIIASALNYQHCIQIVEAYRARGQRAEYVHSREDSATNGRILERLAAHELDVIVQVRKLGEGFDHPYLSVAAVFSIFRELSPFVQFVGRIMRAIVQDNPQSLQNQGTVVFHAGANVARRWTDFQNYSGADQAFFDQLLPVEDLNFAESNEIQVEPVLTPVQQDRMQVSSQTGVLLQEIPLLAQDEEALRAFELLRERGFTADDYRQATQLQPVPTTRVRERQAARAALDDRVRNEVGRVLAQRNINPRGRTLDRNRLNRDNFIVLKAAIDRRINQLVGRAEGERSEFSRAQLDQISANFDRLIAEASQEVFNG